MTVYPEPGSDTCFGFIQWIFALSHSLTYVMLFLPWMSSLSQGLIHFMLFLLLLSQGVIYALHILTFLPLYINRLVRPGWKPLPCSAAHCTASTFLLLIETHHSTLLISLHVFSDMEFTKASMKGVNNKKQEFFTEAD